MYASEYWKFKFAPEEYQEQVGLGLLNSWFGSSSYVPQRVRFVISTPTFVPVLHESIRESENGERVFAVDIGPEFMEIGNQLAPQRPQQEYLELTILQAKEFFGMLYSLAQSAYGFSHDEITDIIGKEYSRKLGAVASGRFELSTETIYEVIP